MEDKNPIVKYYTKETIYPMEDDSLVKGVVRVFTYKEGTQKSIFQPDYSDEIVEMPSDFYLSSEDALKQGFSIYLNPEGLENER